MSAGAIVALGVLILAIVAGVVAQRTIYGQADRRIVIATASPAGTYYHLGIGLAQILEEAGMAKEVEVRTSAGSLANMTWLSEPAPENEVRFALVQSDTVAASSARLVARLYREVLHVLVATSQADGIRQVSDLSGRRVALGEEGSGTRQMALKLARHFEIEPAEAIDLPPDRILEALRRDEIDAAMLLTALPAEMVDELCDSDLVRFLSLGEADERGSEADAVAAVFPPVESVLIPRRAYGRLPEEPVRTVGVWAELVTTTDVDSHLVRRVTRALFEGRGTLAGHRRTASVDASERMTAEQRSLAARIRESYDPAATVVPYHEGAVAYYRRDEPPFLVTYAEPLSLGLTVMAGLFSLSLAVREALRRKRKNRIDAYYLEVEELTADRATGSVEELEVRSAALDDVRRRAFADLVAERVEANESFVIFQDFLRAELQLISNRLSELRESA